MLLNKQLFGWWQPDGQQGNITLQGDAHKRHSTVKVTLRSPRSAAP
jgi:hypothetical protein